MVMNFTLEGNSKSHSSSPRLTLSDMTSMECQLLYQEFFLPTHSKWTRCTMRTANQTSRAHQNAHFVRSFPDRERDLASIISSQAMSVVPRLCAGMPLPPANEASPWFIPIFAHSLSSRRPCRSLLERINVDQYLAHRVAQCLLHRR